MIRGHTGNANNRSRHGEDNLGRSADRIPGGIGDRRIRDQQVGAVIHDGIEADTRRRVVYSFHDGNWNLLTVIRPPVRSENIGGRFERGVGHRFIEVNVNPPGTRVPNRERYGRWCCVQDKAEFQNRGRSAQRVLGLQADDVRAIRNWAAKHRFHHREIQHKPAFSSKRDERQKVDEVRNRRRIEPGPETNNLFVAHNGPCNTRIGGETIRHERIRIRRRV